ncbi:MULTISPECIES: BPL-N domain-containing protein [Aliagarivorans]|uniref:BPL-N domain-containing protein n=1 Tax=Aliagarivorans TaxID=882379 RepID=UPI000414146C|nr:MULTISPECIES: BPL-N domain-containing protein [Aliagarivorans]
MKILIYSDNVSANHVLYYSLGKLRGKQGIYFVNANEILAGALDADINLFVMPGGASRYKAAKLNGEANRRIKDYVAQGGRYLGICAGAYMACETTHWAKDQPYEIVTQNELSFFPGLAKGPVEAFGRGDSYNGTAPRLVEIELAESGFASPNPLCFKSLYIGGCVFEKRAETRAEPSAESSIEPNDETGFQVLARFSELPDKPAAIVSGEHGQGRWLLCSPHPEYDHEALQLLAFDVVGNDYSGFNAIGASAKLDLSLLDYLLNTLER